MGKPGLTVGCGLPAFLAEIRQNIEARPAVQGRKSIAMMFGVGVMLVSEHPAGSLTGP